MPSEIEKMVEAVADNLKDEIAYLYTIRDKLKKTPEPKTTKIIKRLKHLFHIIPIECIDVRTELRSIIQQLEDEE